MVDTHTFKPLSIFVEAICLPLQSAEKKKCGLVRGEGKVFVPFSSLLPEGNRTKGGGLREACVEKKDLQIFQSAQYACTICTLCTIFTANLHNIQDLHYMLNIHNLYTDRGLSDSLDSFVRSL